MRLPAPGSGRMWVLGITATFCGLFLLPGFALQIQCYQCEEFQLNNDCSSPEFIVNCTVNVQDMCQKEVMEQSAGQEIMHRRKNWTTSPHATEYLVTELLEAQFPSKSNFMGPREQAQLLQWNARPWK
nr:ly6/PLAUR domain-containing protein 1 isoform X1 [Equus asinus]